MTVWEVFVGNIGSVYSGRDSSEAIAWYRDYVGLSKRPFGRCAGEDVVLFKNGDIVWEHEGSGDKEI